MMLNATRLLLIEDNADARNVLCRLLTWQGYDVHAHGSAETAAEDLPGYDPEIALLDVRLPGMHGDDYACELVRLRPSVRIIFLTAEAVVEHLAERVPGALVLRKPINMAKLFAALAALH